MQPNMIGAYGAWAAGLVGDGPPLLSFRHEQWANVETWRSLARQRLLDRLAQPDTGNLPPVTVQRRFTYDELDIEELAWQLPYGPPTQAVFLKPAGSTGKLPGMLALHDHAGKKYFGWRKIARTADNWHPLMIEHYDQYYSGLAWANQLAKRGYAVLVPDAFPFASRRVLVRDVAPSIRAGLSDEDPEEIARIHAYHHWAAEHESIMAKSLFCAGTTWPGVFVAEDQRALDVLCARAEVDPARIGCGGLSGGGMRTVFLSGVDPRIRCAVCVGMMTTWRDYLLNKAYTHTWMVYVPLLPRELDYPDILSLHVPRPVLVQNNVDDELFTLSEMERANMFLRDVYDKAGAGNRYRGSFYAGPHKFDRQMQSDAFTWFDQWLR